MPYQLIIPKRVQKQLDGLPERVYERIREQIVALSDVPRPPGTKKLEGYQDRYRVRVGDYRVVYIVDDTARRLELESVRHRSDVYRQ